MNNLQRWRALAIGMIVITAVLATTLIISTIRNRNQPTLMEDPIEEDEVEPIIGIVEGNEDGVEIVFEPTAETAPATGILEGNILESAPFNNNNRIVIGSADQFSDTVFATRTLQAYRGSGTLLANDPQTILQVAEMTNFAVADADGDGDLDIAISRTDLPNQLYLQTENGFQLAWTAVSSADSRELAWGDMDGDGDLDLAVANAGAPTWVYEMTNGTLSAEPIWDDGLNELTNDMAWADMNGDGYLDLLLANAAPHPNRLFLNDGVGGLEETAVWQAYPNRNAASVAVADSDADGDLDVAFGFSGNETGGVLLLENDGAGNLTEARNIDQARVIDIAWADVDEDGYPELSMADFAPGLGDGVHPNLDGTLALVAWFPAENGFVWSLAWGDVDGDGDLDLAFGYDEDRHEAIFLNENGDLSPTPAWESDGFGFARHVAWADIDSDRDLDLLVQYQNQISVYVNQQASFTFRASARDSSQPDDFSNGIDLADINGNGKLDLVVGNSGISGTGAINTIHLDIADGFSAENSVTFSQLVSETTAVSFGFANDDDILDLAVANGGYSGDTHNLIYYGTRSGDSVTFSDDNVLRLPETENSTDLAWGDVDGDGDLDLAVANYDGANRLYINDGGNLVAQPPFTFGTVVEDGETRFTLSNGVAWGDADGDGDLDLAVANEGELNYVYFNVNGRISDDLRLPFGSDTFSNDVDWGDINGDGLLDIAVANSVGANELYLNLGGSFALAWQSNDLDDTASFRFGDADNDGDLDLVAANRGGVNEVPSFPNKLYLNQNGRLQTALDNSLWNSTETLPTLDVAWGDVDQDGDFDLVFANGIKQFRGEQLRGSTSPNQLYENVLSPVELSSPASDPAAIAILGLQSNGAPLPLLDTQATIIDNGVLEIEYQLFHPTGQPYRAVRGFYSLDGGDTFRPAQPVSGTQTTNLGDGQYTFAWDVYASGFFGVSSNVVFRLEAYETVPSDDATAPDTYSYDNQAAVEPQRPFVAAQTFPLRVRGNQVQVLFSCDADSADVRPCPDTNSGVDDEPLANTAVFGLAANQASGANLLQSASGSVFRTDGTGFLQGRTILSEGDQLVALWPVPTETIEITFTNRARLFYLSASPTITGVNTARVNGLDGVQTLTVSNADPLLLYDLVVSVEWDASRDAAFMTELEGAFVRASEILFDVSNGQVALGNVYVFHGKRYWNVADVQILANNDLRPSAAIGGVVIVPLSETLENGRLIQSAYLPGQIRMGPSWDPFGQSAAELTEDWYRALAHELAHYFFFLPDNYLGIEDGVLRRINCQGSFMTTTRDPAYSEFLTQAEWEADGDCEKSLAEQTTGRNDWETIQAFYPFLNAPENISVEFEIAENGPVLLPFNVTQMLSFSVDYGERELLPPRIFEIRNAENDRIRVPNAQVYLIQTQGTLTDGVGLTDDVLVNLGTPFGGGDRIQVRGAFAGDQLCVFDDSQTPPLHSCETLDAADVSIQLFERSDDSWQPLVDATAVSDPTNAVSQTVLVTVTQQLAQGEQLRVQVYPAHYGSFAGNAGLAGTAVITGNGASEYTATVPMRLPAFDIAVRVWQPSQPRFDSINSFRVKQTWPSTAFQPPRAITVPINANFSYRLIGFPNDVPLGGPNDVPLGGSNNLPLGSPNDVPLGGPNDVPLGGPNDVPLGGPNDVPLGGPNDVPLGGPNDVPLGGPNDVPLGGPNDVPLGGPNDVPLGGPNDVPLGGPNDVPLGGGDLLGANAPILSADAQLLIYNNRGFFEDNGVETLRLLSGVPNLPSWMVRVGQGYEVTFSESVTAARSIAFNYLQRDVPEGYENALRVAFLPDGESEWHLIETQQYPENLIVAQRAETPTPSDYNGTYLLVATVELPALENGWNLVAYTVPVSRSVEIAFASVAPHVKTVVAGEATLEAPTDGAFEDTITLRAKVTLNLRSTPSVANSPIGFLPSGAVGQIVQYEPGRAWQQIDCEQYAFAGVDAPTCWVTGLERFVEIGGNTAVSPQNEQFLQFGQVYWVFVEGLPEGESLNLYLAPPVQGIDGMLR